jgi:hypothetical protein
MENIVKTFSNSMRITYLTGKENYNIINLNEAVMVVDVNLKRGLDYVRYTKGIRDKKNVVYFVDIWQKHLIGVLIREYDAKHIHITPKSDKDIKEIIGYFLA